MSKEVGAGGKFDIFLDSASTSQTNHTEIIEELNIPSFTLKTAK